MSWKCILEGHEDVVVAVPPAARQWLVDQNLDMQWRLAFEWSEDTLNAPAPDMPLP